MKAITFLGIKPTETCYLFPDGREHVAPYFGVALARFLPELQLRVLVTEATRSHFEQIFLPQVEDYVADVQPIPIPDGRSDNELWDIFQAVVNGVETGESVVFDITHGFRSLPFLSFLSVAYLRTVKQIALQGVFYGNLEASDRSGEISRTPVIDLTRFVELFDWMIGADRFVRFGDARDLAKLLDERHRQMKPDPLTADKAELSAWNNSPVKQTASSLTRASRALRVVRPTEAMDASAQVCAQLPAALASSAALAQPFTLLGHHMLESFKPIALDRQTQQRNPQQALSTERRLIGWYLERNQVFQAVALAREWLISWAMVRLGMQEDLLGKSARSSVEKELGQALQQRQQKTIDVATEETQVDLGALPSREEVVQLYGELGDLRNDLMHAGKRKGALPAQKVEEKAHKLYGRLKALPC
ncbi:TIGR02221 family CRISPR-associated protein [Caldilinea sp.]|uniref:TIGR02221 family CRISPR-associated protein n=1 Tax=Caldilinea sp. TaxID=2293560 RepID=UPI001B1BA159|nr:TIGR02221 family CRISPR-associated protein [Caldilinea sp.]MBO9394412.1 TIGR02221 family CRISPR-associated protein [Caldilinea sp.]